MSTPLRMCYACGLASKEPICRSQCTGSFRVKVTFSFYSSPYSAQILKSQQNYKPENDLTGLSILKNPASNTILSTSFGVSGAAVCA